MAKVYPRGRSRCGPPSKEDAARVAQLHAAGINEGFLATLGPRFLRRLYERMVASRRAFLIVAYDPQDGGGTDARTDDRIRGRNRFGASSLP